MISSPQPTATQITRYREIYYRLFGIDISEQQARQEGAALMQEVWRIYRPLTKQEYEKYRAAKGGESS